MLPPAELSEVVEQLETWFLAEVRSSLQAEREAVTFSADRAGLLASGSPLVALSALAAIGRKERSRMLPLIEYSASRHFSRILARSLAP